MMSHWTRALFKSNFDLCLFVFFFQAENSNPESWNFSKDGQRRPGLAMYLCGKRDKQLLLS